MQQGRAAAGHAFGAAVRRDVDRAAARRSTACRKSPGRPTQEQVTAANSPTGRDLRSGGYRAGCAIAVHGGLLKLIFCADDRTYWVSTVSAKSRPKMVGLGHVVRDVAAHRVVPLLALKTPTYSYAYHDAAIDGLTRLARAMTSARRPLSGTPWQQRREIDLRYKEARSRQEGSWHETWTTSATAPGSVRHDRPQSSPDVVTSWRQSTASSAG